MSLGIWVALWRREARPRIYIKTVHIIYTAYDRHSNSTGYQTGPVILGDCHEVSVLPGSRMRPQVP